MILTADLHGNTGTHDYIIDGKSMRQEEQVRVYAELLGLAKNDGHESIVILGDVAHLRRPAPWWYVVFGQFLDECDAQGIEVFAMYGNHDAPPVGGGMYPLSAFASYAALTLMDTMDRYSYQTPEGYDLFPLSWTSRAHFAAAHPDMPVQEQYEKMAANFSNVVSMMESRVEAERPALLVTHFTISGSKYNSEAQPLLGESSDFMLPRSVVDRTTFDYIISGHIHKPQDIDGRIWYPGSAISVDFGDEEQRRVLTFDGTEIESVPLLSPTRFHTIMLDDMDTMNANAVEGAIVRVKGSVPRTEDAIHQLKQLKEDAEKFGALRVAKSAIKFDRVEARSEHDITVEVTPTQALDSFIEMVGGEYVTYKDGLLVLHEQLMEGVQA